MISFILVSVFFVTSNPFFAKNSRGWVLEFPYWEKWTKCSAKDIGAQLSFLFVEANLTFINKIKIVKITMSYGLVIFFLIKWPCD